MKEILDHCRMYMFDCVNIHGNSSKIDIYFSNKFTKRLLEYPIKILFYPCHLFHKHHVGVLDCSVLTNESIESSTIDQSQTRTGNTVQIFQKRSHHCGRKPANYLNILNNITLWWHYWKNQQLTSQYFDKISSSCPPQNCISTLKTFYRIFSFKVNEVIWDIIGLWDLASTGRHQPTHACKYWVT